MTPLLLSSSKRIKVIEKTEKAAALALLSAPHHIWQNQRAGLQMTAKRLTFTELALDRLSQEGTYWDNHTSAFGCRVGKTKKTLFIVRSDGSREIVGYVGQTDLKAARRRAQTLLLSAPEAQSSLTFQEAFELYAATKLKDYRERSRNEVRRLIEKHLQARFPSKVSDTNHHHIQTILADLKPSEANHLFGVLRTFFTWCEKRELCTSPIRKLDKPYKEKSRDRILSDDELRKLWIATATPSTFHSIVRLCLLTGQRRGEISQIQREWISSTNGGAHTCPNSTSALPSLKTAASPNLWLTIPKHITKNGVEHQIPLPALAVALLPTQAQANNTSLLFPARTTTRAKLSTTSQNNSFNGWSKSKKQLDELSGISGWVLHDLRRTTASNMARIGISLPVIEKILNHRSGSFGGIVGVYQRHQYRDEMRDAMERYEKFLMSLLAADISTP